MAAKKRSKKESARTGRGAGEMPAGGMNEPVTKGLAEMPSGEDRQASVADRAAGSATQAGLMPGEAPSQSRSRDGEMPGGGMSSM
jgi:hypothetical protein